MISAVDIGHRGLFIIFHRDTYFLLNLEDGQNLRIIHILGNNYPGNTEIMFNSIHGCNKPADRNGQDNYTTNSDFSFNIIRNVLTRSRDGDPTNIE